MNDWNHEPDHDPWASPRNPSRQHRAFEEQLTSSQGTLVLILGLISWFACGFFTALPGFLIARSERKQIRSGLMAPDTALEVGYWLNLVLLIIYGLTLSGIFFFLLVGAAL